MCKKKENGSANAGSANAGSANAGTSNAGTANAGSENAGTTNAGTKKLGAKKAGAEKAGKGESIDYMIDETIDECKEEYEKIKEAFLRQYSKDLNNPMIHTFDKCMIEQLNRETFASKIYRSHFRNKYVMCDQMLKWNYKKCEDLLKQNVIDLIYLLKPMSDKLKYYY